MTFKDSQKSGNPVRDTSTHPRIIFARNFFQMVVEDFTVAS